MTEIQDLRCFQHCDRFTNIICFSVPLYCPICGKNTSETNSRIPPFLLPSPLSTDTTTLPLYSLVLKPTDGNCLSDFTNTSNLHIGVTDSKGTVYDFDEDGLHVGSRWKQFIPIQVPQLQNTDIVAEHWDYCLQHFSQLDKWKSRWYHETENNCFDFVLGFLRSLPSLRTLSSLSSKRTFCQNFIVNKTERASQYISLYKQVLQNGYVCQKT